MTEDMRNIRVMIGSVEAHNGFRQENRRVVEFTGQELGSLTSYDPFPPMRCLTTSRGYTEALYRAQDGRLLLHTVAWSRWQGEWSMEDLYEVQEGDLVTGGLYELLGAECGFGQPLSLENSFTGRELGT